MLENKESSGLDEYNLKQSIKDWNVSHSTLEEVFMKVTRESEDWTGKKENNDSYQYHVQLK